MSNPKIIKLKLRERFKYKRKVIIKNLILNMFIGIHNFEKKKKQRVRFNIEVVTNPYIKPSNKDLSTILNYEDLINKIKYLLIYIYLYRFICNFDVCVLRIQLIVFTPFGARHRRFVSQKLADPGMVNLDLYKVQTNSRPEVSIASGSSLNPR